MGNALTAGDGLTVAEMSAIESYSLGMTSQSRYDTDDNSASVATRQQLTVTDDRTSSGGSARHPRSSNRHHQQQARSSRPPTRYDSGYDMSYDGAAYDGAGGGGDDDGIHEYGADHGREYEYTSPIDDSQTENSSAYHHGYRMEHESRDDRERNHSPRTQRSERANSPRTDNSPRTNSPRDYRDERALRDERERNPRTNSPRANNSPRNYRDERALRDERERSGSPRDYRKEREQASNLRHYRNEAERTITNSPKGYQTSQEISLQDYRNDRERTSSPRDSRVAYQKSSNVSNSSSKRDHHGQRQHHSQQQHQHQRQPHQHQQQRNMMTKRTTPLMDGVDSSTAERDITIADILPAETDMAAYAGSNDEQEDTDTLGEGSDTAIPTFQYEETEEREGSTERAASTASSVLDSLARLEHQQREIQDQLESVQSLGDSFSTLTKTVTTLKDFDSANLIMQQGDRSYQSKEKQQDIAMRTSPTIEEMNPAQKKLEDLLKQQALQEEKLQKQLEQLRIQKERLQQLQEEKKRPTQSKPSQDVSENAIKIVHSPSPPAPVHVHVERVPGGSDQAPEENHLRRDQAPEESPLRMDQAPEENPLRRSGKDKASSLQEAKEQQAIVERLNSVRQKVMPPAQKVPPPAPSATPNKDKKMASSTKSYKGENKASSKKSYKDENKASSTKSQKDENKASSTKSQKDENKAGSTKSQKDENKASSKKSHKDENKGKNTSPDNIDHHGDENKGDKIDPHRDENKGKKSHSQPHNSYHQQEQHTKKTSQKTSQKELDNINKHERKEDATVETEQIIYVVEDFVSLEDKYTGDDVSQNGEDSLTGTATGEMDESIPEFEDVPSQCKLNPDAVAPYQENDLTTLSASVTEEALDECSTVSSIKNDPLQEALTSMDEEIDMDFVAKYDRAFTAFLNKYPALFDQNSELIQNLKVAKLQKILEVSYQTECDLEARLEHKSDVKTKLETEFQEKLREASRQKAARSIQLQSDLNHVKKESRSMEGKLTWEILLTAIKRATKLKRIKADLKTKHLSSREDLINALPVELFDVKKAITASPRESFGSTKELHQYQVENAFLNSEVKVLEQQIASLKEDVKKQAWVDSVLVRLDSKKLNKLKGRHQKKLGVSF